MGKIPKTLRKPPFAKSLSETDFVCKNTASRQLRKRQHEKNYQKQITAPCNESCLSLTFEDHASSDEILLYCTIYVCLKTRC